MYLDTAQRLYLINIIAGISNRGNVYYTINRGKNNSKTFIAYLVKLIEHLDKENPYWRETTIFVFDNARYHRSSFIMNWYRALNIPIMFLGPY